MKRATRAINKSGGRINETTKRKPTVGQPVRTAQAQLGKAIRIGDKPTVRKLLAPQFTWITEHGALLSRIALLGGLTVAAVPRANSGVKVRMYGDVAMVTGQRKSATGDALFFVDVWTKGRNGWRALIRHDNILADADAPVVSHASQPRSADAKPPECVNPLKFIPYKAKSKAERDIVTAFQALEKNVTQNDAAQWVTHMADEFVVTRTRQHPTTKASRAAFIAQQAAVNAETWVAEVERMQLWVLGDAAVMRADHRMPENRRPPYRATRIWVKRDGRWQMAVSQQTTLAG